MKTLKTDVGIYDSEYRLICHRDKSISVREPFIKWTFNCGSLSFRTVKIKKRFQAEVLACFEGKKEGMSIEDIMYEHEILNR